MDKAAWLQTQLTAACAKQPENQVSTTKRAKRKAPCGRAGASAVHARSARRRAGARARPPCMRKAVHFLLTGRADWDRRPRAQQRAQCEESASHVAEQVLAYVAQSPPQTLCEKVSSGEPSSQACVAPHLARSAAWLHRAQAGLCAALDLSQVLRLLMRPTASTEDVCSSCKSSIDTMLAALSDANTQSQARARAFVSGQFAC